MHSPHGNWSKTKDFHEARRTSLSLEVSAEAYGVFNKMKTDWEAPEYPKTDAQKTRIRKVRAGAVTVAQCTPKVDIAKMRSVPS